MSNRHSLSPELTPIEIGQWLEFIERQSAIELGADKAYLIQSRLTPLLKRFGVHCLSELYKLALSNRAEVTEAIVSAVSTHETSFFRDREVFDALKKSVIPSILDRSESLYVWSAACAAGQEPYSLAMVCSELPREYSRKTIRIVGTDICAKSIETARRGVYTDFELGRGLDNARIERYFTKDGKKNRIRDSIKSMVEFEQCNIFSTKFRKGPFGLVVCRNVAMYFSRTKRIELFRSLAACLNPGGVLVVGAGESLVGLVDCFKLSVVDNCCMYTVRA